MSDESQKEEIKDETHQLQDIEQDELEDDEEDEFENDEVELTEHQENNTSTENTV
ncbi:MAG TPA: hypothetical protein VK882_03855 [Nitrososphaeraceae archaeon]|jgi:hypothetical protein|nr:hypothetical protein [Nitrososphaeraceae archaeon]